MELPGTCPCCGSLVLAPETQSSILVAVSEALVLKALEQLGKYLVRAERARYRELNGRPFCVAHTIWRAPDALVDKALRGTWDVVPLIIDSRVPNHVSPDDVICVLSEYVHDLAIVGAPYTTSELEYRFAAYLELPVEVRA